MSRRDYPRWGESHPLKEGSTHQCAIYNCEARAEWVVRMQFSWFRGEDECAYFCKDHRDRGINDPAGMCASTRKEAWK